MKKNIRKTLQIISLMLCTLMLLTACNGGGASGTASSGDSDDIAELLGLWIYNVDANSSVRITFYEDGIYIQEDSTETFTSEYEYKDGKVTLSDNTTFINPGHINDMGTLQFGDEMLPDHKRLEKEVRYNESDDLIDMSDMDITGEWKRNYGGNYSCILNEDGTFKLTDPIYNDEGTYQYDGKELELFVNTTGATYYGHFENAEDPKLYIYNLAGYYTRDNPPVATPSPTVAPTVAPDTNTLSFFHGNGIIGEWYDAYHDITIDFYENGDYQIIPVDGLEIFDIPASGSYLESYGTIYFTPEGKNSDSSNAHGEMYVLLEGDSEGGLTLDYAHYYFSKQNERPTGVFPAEDPHGNDDGSGFSELGLEIEMWPNGDRYVHENGSNYYVTADGSDYTRTYAEFAVDILSDTDDGEHRTMIFEVTTYVPNFAVPMSVRTSYDYSHYRHFSFVDYQTGTILPTTDKFRSEVIGDISTYGHTVELPSGDVDLALGIARSYEYEVGEDYYVNTALVTAIFPVDYENLTIAAWAQAPTYEEHIQRVSEFDFLVYGTTISELEHVDIDEALYCRIY